MNQQKLHNWSFTGSIHTLSIKSPGIAKTQTQAAEDSAKIYIRTGDEIESFITINPNKYDKDIFCFSNFERIIAAITSECGVDYYEFIRTDFRLDNYDPKFYQSYLKLTRYIMAALSLTYGIKNNYITNDMFTLRQRSQAIKGKDIEVENYDRAAKSRQTENHNEPAQSRLEFRTMPREWRSIYLEAEGIESNMDLLKKSLTKSWFEKLDAASKNFDYVQRFYNDNLEQIYREITDASNLSMRVRSATDFIMWYQDCIFTRKQLIDLYRRLDSSADPVLRADNHKRRYGMEFFSKSDMRIAVAEIKRAVTEFFAK